MPRPKAKVLEEGREGCIHYETIDNGTLVGTCLKCGRQRSYGEETRLPAWMKDRMSKGGKTERKPIGTANTESRVWNGMEGQKSKRTLVKGVDFG